MVDGVTYAICAVCGQRRPTLLMKRLRNGKLVCRALFIRTCVKKPQYKIPGARRRI